MSDKALKDLQKAWGTVAEDHFKKMTGWSGSLEAKYQEKKTSG